MYIIGAVCILGVYAMIGGAALAAPAPENMKYAVPLLILNALASYPILSGMIWLDGHLHFMAVVDLFLSIFPEAVAQVLSFILIPSGPALVFFLLLRLFAKRYSALFRQKRLFGTLVCSSAAGLLCYFIAFLADY